MPSRKMMEPEFGKEAATEDMLWLAAMCPGEGPALDQSIITTWMGQSVSDDLRVLSATSRGQDASAKGRGVDSLGAPKPADVAKPTIGSVAVQEQQQGQQARGQLALLLTAHRQFFELVESGGVMPAHERGGVSTPRVEMFGKTEPGLRGWGLSYTAFDEKVATQADKRLLTVGVWISDEDVDRQLILCNQCSEMAHHLRRDQKGCSVSPVPPCRVVCTTVYLIQKIMCTLGRGEQPWTDLARHFLNPTSAKTVLQDMHYIVLPYSDGTHWTCFAVCLLEKKIRSAT